MQCHGHFHLIHFNIAFDYLLMLTIFHVQNVLIILDWCLCDFLVLKHIHELHTCDLYWLFTDVDIFLCGKCSRISILLLVIYWCWLFVMCKMFLSFLIDFYVIYWWTSLDIYWCWHIFVCKMFQNFNITFDYLLMLTSAKCSYHSQLMFFVIFLYWNISLNGTHFIFIGHLLMLINCY